MQQFAVHSRSAPDAERAVEIQLDGVAAPEASAIVHAVPLTEAAAPHICRAFAFSTATPATSATIAAKSIRVTVISISWGHSWTMLPSVDPTRERFVNFRPRMVRPAGSGGAKAGVRKRVDAVR